MLTRLLKWAPECGAALPEEKHLGIGMQSQGRYCNISEKHRGHSCLRVTTMSNNVKTSESLGKQHSYTNKTLFP